jgi:hypothetical protein
VAQGVGPEFKPQTCKKEKKKQNWTQSLGGGNKPQVLLPDPILVGGRGHGILVEGRAVLLN